jgi:hypothetical protein
VLLWRTFLYSTLWFRIAYVGWPKGFRLVLFTSWEKSIDVEANDERWSTSSN